MKKLDMGDSQNLVQILREHWTIYPRLNNLPHQRHIVEVGVHRGKLSRAILAGLSNAFSLHLTMVDSWDVYHPQHSYALSGDGCAFLTKEEQEENYQAACQGVSGFHRYSIHRQTSVCAALNPEIGSAAAILLDGSHVYEDLVIDMAIWWERLEPNGVFAGHDIDHPKDKRGVWGVRRAVERFCRDNQLTFKTMGTCWWIVKP